MSGSAQQERRDEFLRKSLLGEELINTQFHLFSARSPSSGRVFKPRVLCANNVLLAKSSKYFLDLLSTDINPSDPSLIDLTDNNDVPNDDRIDDYGYGSDSDLDECNDLVENVEKAKDRSSTNSTSPGTRSKDNDELSDDESVSSDMFVMSPEHPRMDDPFSANGAGSVASSETAVQEACGNKTSMRHTAVRLRSLGSRHVLVKDTAFQTWYTLLNYLYTDKFNFLPLSSTTPGGQPHESSTSSLDEPRCSAKSMYRLACKVGLDDLRNEAFSYIRSNLTEQNILNELSCTLVAKHPDLLEMELDVFYSHIASPSVVAGFSALARRVANQELPHGADIIVGIHARFLKELRPLPFKPPPPPSTLRLRLFGTQVEPEVREGDMLEGEDRDESRSREDTVPRTESPINPFGSSEFVSDVLRRSAGKLKKGGGGKKKMGSRQQCETVPSPLLASQSQTLALPEDNQEIASTEANDVHVAPFSLQVEAKSRTWF